MDTLDLYLIMQADDLRSTALATAVLLLIVSAVLGFILLMMSGIEPAVAKKIVGYSWVRKAASGAGFLILTSSLILIIVPTTKSLLLIFSADYVLQLEQVEEISPKAVEALNKLLDDYLDTP